MKLPKQKSAAVVDKAKRRLENPVAKAQKFEKAADDAERLRKIQRTVGSNIERLRAMAERQSATGAKGLAVEASRKSTRRKTHPQIFDEKVEKARAEAKRRSVAGTGFLAVEATRLSSRRKTDLLTVDQRAKKPWQMQLVIDKLGSLSTSSLCDSICDGCRFHCCECFNFK